MKGQTTPFFTGWKIMAFRIKTQGESRKKRGDFSKMTLGLRKCELPKYILTSHFEIEKLGY